MVFCVTQQLNFLHLSFYQTATSTSHSFSKAFFVFLAMNKYSFIIFAFILLLSCNTENSQNSQADPVAKITDSFFPVTSYIKGQIITLDSLPITPLHITLIKGKADSAYLSKEKTKALLQPFLKPVITETNLTQYFKEIRFNDQTINAITFTYDPVNKLPDSISLRHWDVYINPEKGEVSKIYIVNQVLINNELFTQQLTWQSNRMAKIVTILNKEGGEAELLKEEIFTWDF